MKLSELEDTEYFSRTHDDSPRESESKSSDSSSSGSTFSDELRQEDSDVDSMSSSSVEEEEGNDVEVVWAKSARGVWGLGHVFDGKLYFMRDICEEKWIPKDLVPPKKSVAAPKARAKAALQPRAKPAAKRTGLAVQAGAKAAAKPTVRAIASSSSANATQPVPVMRTEHVQQFKVCYSRAQKFFAIPLDLQ